MLRGAKGRDAVLVLVTDGQVGNEDQILRQLSADLRGVQVHTVGIDRAVNAGFLHRLADAGGGRCELVESEERLDEAMDAIHRRISAPLAQGLGLRPEGLAILDDTISPSRLPDLFAGVPLVVAGRYRGSAAGSLVVGGTTGDGRDWTVSVAGQPRKAPAITAQWARAHLRDLEDRYTRAPGWGEPGSFEELAERIVGTSLRFGVLCRFTAYVAIDSRVVADGGVQHRVLQPVEAPSGWDLLAAQPMMAAPAAGLDYLLGDECAPIGFGTPMQPATRSRLRREDVGGPSFSADSGPERSSRSRRSRAYLDDTVSAGTPKAALPSPRTVQREHPQLAAAREQVRDEARQLREAGPLSDDERAERLAELASRLNAIVRHLSAQGVPRSAYSALLALHARLTEVPDTGDAFWDYVLQVLDDFAGDTGSQKKLRPFWKRS